MSQLLPVGTTHALIDEKDYIRASLHAWWYDKSPVALIDGKRTSLARYILCASGREKVYNKNGDKLDCRRSNLTTKRGETEWGQCSTTVYGLLRSEVSRHIKMTVEIENYTGETPDSGKLRDRIARAEAVLNMGDRGEMVKMLKIMRRIK